MPDEDAKIRNDIRLMRGSILRALDITYGRTPDTCGIESIRHVVRPDNEKMFLTALAYLADDGVGCIKRVESKIDKHDREPLILYRLLAKGKRILEGVEEDPCILLY